MPRQTQTEIALAEARARFDDFKSKWGHITDPEHYPEWHRLFTEVKAAEAANKAYVNSERNRKHTWRGFFSGSNARHAAHVHNRNREENFSSSGAPAAIWNAVPSTSVAYPLPHHRSRRNRRSRRRSTRRN